MRDYSSNYDFDPYAESEQRSFNSLQAVALVGAVALIAAPFIATFARRWRSQQEAAKTEPQIDKTLKDTFPASDPPASRYFDIPENRL